MRFRPRSYHNGTVWPVDNYTIALGLAHRGYVGEAEEIRARLRAMCEATRRYPEFVAGLTGPGDPVTRRIVDIYDEINDRPNRLEQPPQESPSANRLVSSADWLRPSRREHFQLTSYSTAIAIAGFASTSAGPESSRTALDYWVAAFAAASFGLWAARRRRRSGSTRLASNGCRIESPARTAFGVALSCAPSALAVVGGIVDWRLAVVGGGVSLARALAALIDAWRTCALEGRYQSTLFRVIPSYGVFDLRRPVFVRAASGARHGA